MNRKIILGSSVLFFIVMMAVIGPYISGYSYSEQNLAKVNLAPGELFWFGSDGLGRDIFTRVWYGARISLALGIGASLIALVIGSIYGSVSALSGGKKDLLMMRLIDILWAVPHLLYVIMISVLVDSNLLTLTLVVGLIYWLSMARLVRGQLLFLKEQEFVLAARAMGAGFGRLLFVHLLPNTFGVMILHTTIVIPEIIFAEAFLSFLGLGVEAPLSSWGVMINDGITSLRTYPWQFFFPAIIFTLTIWAFNLLGDGLRDRLDPRGCQGGGL